MLRRIVIMDSNYIRIFGVNGPITTPTQCDDATILALINAGHKVYEKFADGTTKRLSRADFEVVPADQVKPAAKVAQATVKVDVPADQAKVETPVYEEGKVFNGVSATTEAIIPDKIPEETPDTTVSTKAQRKAQKRAKLEAAKEAAEENRENIG